MERLGNNVPDTQKKQAGNITFEQVGNETKDKLQEVLEEIKLQNILRIGEGKYVVGVKGVRYYVCYISRKYNFDSGFETENKMLMDAWGIIDKVSSAGVVFVSKNEDKTSLQYVFYDGDKDQISYKESDNNGEAAFKAVEKYKTNN